MQCTVLKYHTMCVCLRPIPAWTADQVPILSAKFDQLPTMCGCGHLCWFSTARDTAKEKVICVLLHLATFFLLIPLIFISPSLLSFLLPFLSLLLLPPPSFALSLSLSLSLSLTHTHTHTINHNVVIIINFVSISVYMSF